LLSCPNSLFLSTQYLSHTTWVLFLICCVMLAVLLVTDVAPILTHFQHQLANFCASRDKWDLNIELPQWFVTGGWPRHYYTSLHTWQV
jgi:hypothetical protein